MVKNKNLKEVTVEQLQAEARCIVQHPGLGETGDPICIFYFVQKNYYTALVSCFYILLFSVYIVIVNTAKSGTGLDNLSVDIYIYIYIYIIKFRSSGRNSRKITCLLFP